MALAGKITALRAQTRRQGRVNVYLDGAFAFALPDIVAATLRIGQALSDDDIARLCRRDAEERAYDRALHFLSYRPRSIEEVSRYLVGKQVAEDLVAETIERLLGAGLLDDHAFARFWVENRASFRPRGGAALRYELRRKGVSGEAIEAALAGLDEQEAAYLAAEPRAARYRAAGREAFCRKLGDYLRRRGFSYATVRETVERLCEDQVPRDGAGGQGPGHSPARGGRD